MSYSKFVKANLSNKQAENQFLNGIFTNHDLACRCDDPAAHLTYLLATKCQPKNFTDKEKQEIKECLGLTTTDLTATDAVDTIVEGDLDRLFEEDFTEDTG